MNFIKPFKGNYKVTSKHGVARQLAIYNNKLKPHYGTDYGIPFGTELIAVGDGKIIGIYNHKKRGFGQWLILQAEEYFFFYTHLSKILVKKGEVVKQGKIIAHSGNSGASTGPHFHFQICKGNYLAKNYITNTVDAEKLIS